MYKNCRLLSNLNIKKHTVNLLCLMSLFVGLLSVFFGCAECKTGPLISGSYVFESHNEAIDFYGIYSNKNVERFVIPDFDLTLTGTKYVFESSGVGAKIISQKLYDYDFPNPSFKIESMEMYITLYDISFLEAYDNNSLVANPSDNNFYDLEICISNICVASIEYKISVDDVIIEKICNIFKEAMLLIQSD